MGTTETWLEVMPAIALVRGVPVVPQNPKRGLPKGTVTYAYMTEVIVASAEDGEIVGSDAASSWRVDLDDPQGFGYALRKAWVTTACRAYLLGEIQEALGTASLDVSRRYIQDLSLGAIAPTAADRLAVATALAMVA